MGWIRRNRFWFNHHDIYVEPTEEQKEIDRQNSEYYKKYGKTKLMQIMAMTSALSMSIDNKRRY